MAKTADSAARGGIGDFPEKIPQLGSYGGGNHFGEVVRSVELAGLARTVARLDAQFVIRDADKADD